MAIDEYGGSSLGTGPGSKADRVAIGLIEPGCETRTGQFLLNPLSSVSYIPIPLGIGGDAGNP